MVRDHILLMEPLPSMSKPCTTLLQIEKLKEVKITVDIGIYNANANAQKEFVGKKTYDK